MSKKEINIEAYYMKYGPMVLRRCKFLLKDEDKALDAMQDVFVKLMLYQSRLTGNYPPALLYRIATNICLNKIRAQRIRQSVSDEKVLESIAVEDEAERKMTYNSLLEYILKSESESTHDIAVKYFVEGRTLKEIGKELNLSISGVYKRIKRLQRRIQEKGGT